MKKKKTLFYFYKILKLILNIPFPEINIKLYKNNIKYSIANKNKRIEDISKRKTQNRVNHFRSFSFIFFFLYKITMYNNTILKIN